MEETDWCRNVNNSQEQDDAHEYYSGLFIESVIVPIIGSCGLAGGLHVSNINVMRSNLQAT